MSEVHFKSEVLAARDDFVRALRGQLLDAAPAAVAALRTLVENGEAEVSVSS
jgi:hypothetical protein